MFSKSLKLILLFLLLLLLEAQAESASVKPADFVFTGGKVYTVNKLQPRAEAVAVKSNKIVYVGDASGLKNYIGYGTHVVDLHGEMVLPGFMDAHTHLLGGAFVNSGVNLLTDDTEEVLGRLRTYIADHPDQPFILGYGLRRGPWLVSEVQQNILALLGLSPVTYTQLAEDFSEPEKK